MSGRKKQQSSVPKRPLSVPVNPSGTATHRRHKPYPAEFREKAVKMVTELGYSVSEVSQQLGCSEAALHRWRSEAAPLDPVVSQRMELGEDENKRLRKENARLKMEVEILKKATAYFAKDAM
jgi:transposase-like protein